MHIVTFCTTDDETRNPEDVRRLKLQLDRERAFMADTFWRFTIITDYDKTEFKELMGPHETNIRYISIEKEDENDVFHDPSFYLTYAFENYHFNDEDKVVYLDANLLIKNQFIGLIYQGLPDRGDVTHCNLPFITQEQKDNISNNNLPAFYQCEDWTGVHNTKFSPHFLMFHYGQCKELVEKLNDDTLVQSYSTMQEFIEGEFNGEIVRTASGVVGEYYVNDEDENDTLIGKYEKVVKPTFPTEFVGHGGEEDERYLSRDHEYRDMCRQTCMVHLIKNPGQNPAENRYLELWLL